MKKNISILGAGSWGTAISQVLTENNHKVKLWDYNSSVLDAIKETGRHKNLPDFTFDPEKLNLIYDIKEAFESEYIITVIPTQAYQSFWEANKSLVKKDHVIINCSKGIDVTTGLFPSTLFFKYLPDFNKNNYAVLSGPSYATEVTSKIPTAVVISGESKEILKNIQEIFCNNWFRIYANYDVIGVELAGALKNVIAIASGICSGIGYGINSQAALITRGTREIIRLGQKLGAKEQTFYGLAGIGDLTLTATSDKSRNFSLGKLIGKGKTLDESLSIIGMVVEGVETVRAAVKLAKEFNVEMPITNKVYKILFNKENPGKAVIDLMTRNLKEEF